MRQLHQSEPQLQTKVTKMVSQQVGLCSVNTGQSPAMNTFTIPYSHSISRHHPRAKAMQQTKLTKMTRKKGQQPTKDVGTGRRMLSAMIAVFALSFLAITASLITTKMMSKGTSKTEGILLFFKTDFRV